MNVIVPEVSKSISSPFINAELFRVGELRAMVDSGAKTVPLVKEFCWVVLGLLYCSLRNNYLSTELKRTMGLGNFRSRFDIKEQWLI
jgi:hypothetical protein